MILSTLNQIQMIQAPCVFIFPANKTQTGLKETILYTVRHIPVTFLHTILYTRNRMRIKCLRPVNRLHVTTSNRNTATNQTDYSSNHASD